MGSPSPCYQPPPSCPPSPAQLLLMPCLLSPPSPLEKDLQLLSEECWTSVEPLDSPQPPSPPLSPPAGFVTGYNSRESRRADSRGGRLCWQALDIRLLNRLLLSLAAA